MTATQLLVVPRSIPIARGMSCSSLRLFTFLPVKTGSFPLLEAAGFIPQDHLSILRSIPIARGMLRSSEAS